jgi:glycosyltransferase involved in cell wall biosynthesis
MNYIKDMQGRGENITLTGYVDDAMRAALYNRANLVVVPSIYEGFGIPILEAMSYKVPVAVSKIEVFEEVAGEAVAYFDPKSAVSIKNQLEKLLKNPVARQALVQKGTERLKRYSWETVAADVSKEIERLVKRL